jgi:putative ABC transport system permease protein
MALGAQHRDILRLVMKDMVKLGLLGIVIGLAGAITLTRVMVSLLFEVNPTDPATLIGVACSPFLASRHRRSHRNTTDELQIPR